MRREAPAQLGPYVLHERLGVGGMAVVYRAESHGLAGFSKEVALKCLLPHVAEDPTMVRSFVHEARLASHLHHDNVAQTYDLGRVDGTYFIAMEYVAGPTLNQIMRQCATAAGAMPVPIVLSILMQLCDALDHAHNLCDPSSAKPLGIIHRDVSPSNIIVSNTGIVKLIDFGIAKAADSGAKTKTGMIKGKFAYVAPEYTRGHLDLRADLFGLGVVAHELLAARSLFQSKNDFETITRLREMQIQPPSRHNPQVSHDVDDIVMTALQRDPDLRWQSATAMRTAITNATRALDIVVGHQDVRAWVEWAFMQAPRSEDPALDRVIDMLGEPSSAVIELSPAELAELEASGDPFEVPPGRPSMEMVAAVVDEDSGLLVMPAPPPRRRWWLVVAVAVVLLVAAGVVYVYFGYLGHEWPYELDL